MIIHYWYNYACGRCLDVVVMSGQQMKKHFLKCRSIIDVCPKPDSQGSTSDGGQSGSKSSKSHHSRESGSKSKKDKDDRCSNEEKGDKMHSSKSKTDGKATSRDDLQESRC